MGNHDLSAIELFIQLIQKYFTSMGHIINKYIARRRTIGLDESITTVAKELNMTYEDARAMVIKDIQDGELPVLGIRRKTVDE